MKNPKSHFYGAVIWLGILIALAYNSFKKLEDESSRINIHFKTMDDIINGNP